MIVSVPEVAPLTAVHVVPPFFETSHLTVAVGFATAEASKTAFSPSWTIAACGGLVMIGAYCTVSNASLLDVLPRLFLNVAR